MTRPGSTSATEFPTGRHLSIGLSFSTTLNRKPKAGSSPNTEHTSSPALPPTSDSSDVSDDASKTISEPHLFASLTLLRSLTEHTADSFAKQRTGRHTDPELYAIRRMAANLEEPGRAKALQIIHKAMQYRNLTPPRANVPLTIPFLAHDNFTTETQQWLCTLIQHRKALAIPLRLPTQHPGQLSIPQLWQHFHTYVAQVPTDITLHATNDQLTPSPSTPKLRAIRIIALTLDAVTTSVLHNTLHTADVATIVIFALNTCIFRACDHNNQQIPGAGIGSQLSPALCNVAIALIEHS